MVPWVVRSLKATHSPSLDQGSSALSVSVFLGYSVGTLCLHKHKSAPTLTASLRTWSTTARKSFLLLLTCVYIVEFSSFIRYWVRKGSILSTTGAESK
jgi:hypothetical protein